MENSPDLESRVILVTDGRDRDAWRQVEVLESYARELERRDLPTTVLGIGPMVEPGSLVVIDDRQGEWLVASDDPSEISRAFISEYLHVEPVVATDVKVWAGSA